MKNLRNEFPVKTTGEFTQSSQQGNRPLQSDRLGVQKRQGENTEGIKRGQEQECRFPQKGMRTYKEEPRKLENSFAEIQTEGKAIKT